MEDGKRKILIAEDEKPLARALELKLSHEGFAVTVVSNGEEAIAELSKGGFVLLICDLVMPKMDGFHVLQSMKEKQIKIPTIILTNLSQAEDEQRVKSLGATDFFIKSNTPITKVVDHVKEVVG